MRCTGRALSSGPDPPPLPVNAGAFPHSPFVPVVPTVRPRCVTSTSQLGALARRGVNALHLDGCWREVGEMKKREHSNLAAEGWTPSRVLHLFPRVQTAALQPASPSCLPHLPTPCALLPPRPRTTRPPASDTTLDTTPPLVTAKHVWSFFQHPTHTLTPSHTHTHIHTGTCCHVLLRHVFAHMHMCSHACPTNTHTHTYPCTGIHGHKSMSHTHAHTHQHASLAHVCTCSHTHYQAYGVCPEKVQLLLTE